ncbi:hypothetical protein DM01DRAFT_1338125 [Hesseltinella vesiculosa]|uniref:Acid protease n=1 Tax=Hesseltinella vesiculosa TaxID=101127 RepID=A0A1X2GAW1_9FUNG|nr:hypothetical protein DM01DRAFT_1338125 [Hesseltinella vesiculosa]
MVCLASVLLILASWWRSSLMFIATKEEGVLSALRKGGSERLIGLVIVLVGLALPHVVQVIANVVFEIKPTVISQTPLNYTTSYYTPALNTFSNFSVLSTDYYKDAAQLVCSSDPLCNGVNGTNTAAHTFTVTEVKPVAGQNYTVIVPGKVVVGTGFPSEIVSVNVFPAKSYNCNVTTLAIECPILHNVSDYTATGMFPVPLPYNISGLAANAWSSGLDNMMMPYGGMMGGYTGIDKADDVFHVSGEGFNRRDVVGLIGSDTAVIISTVFLRQVYSFADTNVYSYPLADFTPACRALLSAVNASSVLQPSGVSTIASHSYLDPLGYNGTLCHAIYDLDLELWQDTWYSKVFVVNTSTAFDIDQGYIAKGSVLPGFFGSNFNNSSPITENTVVDIMAGMYVIDSAPKTKQALVTYMNNFTVPDAAAVTYIVSMMAPSGYTIWYGRLANVAVASTTAICIVVIIIVACIGTYALFVSNCFVPAAYTRSSVENIVGSRSDSYTLVRNGKHAGVVVVTNNNSYDFSHSYD